MSKDLKERIIKILDEWDDKWNNDLSDEKIADQILELFSLQQQEIVEKIEKIKEVAFENGDGVYDSLVWLIEKLNNKTLTK